MFVVGGESLIDLKEKPVKDGVMPLTAHAGGSPMNCAIALRKMGNDTGFLCPISEDKFGGMIAATVLAVFFVPVFYVVMQSLSEWGSRKRKSTQTPAAKPAPQIVLPSVHETAGHL